MSRRAGPKWLHFGLMPLLWLAGAAAVWLTLTAAALPMLRNNEATLFVYDLIDDLPWAVAGVVVIGFIGLVAAWWFGRSWRPVVEVVATGAALAGVGLVVGQLLFVPWVGK